MVITMYRIRLLILLLVLTTVPAKQSGRQSALTREYISNSSDSAIIVLKSTGDTLQGKFEWCSDSLIGKCISFSKDHETPVVKFQAQELSSLVLPLKNRQYEPLPYLYTDSFTINDSIHKVQYDDIRLGSILSKSSMGSLTVIFLPANETHGFANDVTTTAYVLVLGDSVSVLRKKEKRVVPKDGSAPQIETFNEYIPALRKNMADLPNIKERTARLQFSNESMKNIFKDYSEFHGGTVQTFSNRTASRTNFYHYAELQGNTFLKAYESAEQMRTFQCGYTLRLAYPDLSTKMFAELGVDLLVSKEPVSTVIGEKIMTIPMAFQLFLGSESSRITHGSLFYKAGIVIHGWNISSLQLGYSAKRFSFFAEIDPTVIIANAVDSRKGSYYIPFSLGASVRIGR